ncbi:hypothetical protein [Yinghuangia soli]|uniref:DUF3592 domain-containing protein n=1 Tax=Yinghuangia soli TaxID=2908204 RepID=A0AA41U092_9ACTN|nr:hypothetical protein [Yinghuangia soli]MCF2528346.1 hypothetical protein [Yinghuangia soli]
MPGPVSGLTLRILPRWRLPAVDHHTLAWRAAVFLMVCAVCWPVQVYGLNSSFLEGGMARGIVVAAPLLLQLALLRYYVLRHIRPRPWALMISGALGSLLLLASALQAYDLYMYVFGKDGSATVVEQRTREVTPGSEPTQFCVVRLPDGSRDELRESGACPGAPGDRFLAVYDPANRVAPSLGTLASLDPGAAMGLGAGGMAVMIVTVGVVVRRAEDAPPPARSAVPTGA